MVRFMEYFNKYLNQNLKKNPMGLDYGSYKNILAKHYKRY
jgi:hypothetical protein